jgi:hypothetical protein
MMNGMPVTLDHAIEEVGKYRHGLKVMSGGITLSGGEPLMQDRFGQTSYCCQEDGGAHRYRNQWLLRRSSDRMKKSSSSICAARLENNTCAPRSTHRKRDGANVGLRAQTVTFTAKDLGSLCIGAGVDG